MEEVYKFDDSHSHKRRSVVGTGARYELDVSDFES
jgi:hypothetical protein